MNLNKFLAFGLVIATLSCVCGAEEMQELTTISTGIGMTPELALKEALSAAVQQAAGTLIDAKTMMKNDSIMEEQVLSASDGFIKRFEKIGEARKNRQGLWQIKIQAVVLMKPLKQKLSDTHILVQDTGNSGQNEWAKIISQEASQRDIPALMAEFFRTHPAEKLLVPIVFDEKGRTEGLQLYFPQSGRVVQNKATVSLGVLVVVDLVKYQKQILPDLIFMMEKISSARGPKFVSRSSDYRDVGFSLSPFDRSITTGQYRESWVTLLKNAECSYRNMGKISGSSQRNGYHIAVNISTGKYRAGHQSFQVYVLPYSDNLLKCLRTEERHMKGLGVKLSFLNKTGEEVFSAVRPLTRNAGDVLYMPYDWNGTLISPEFNPSNASMSHFRLASVIDFTCKIPVDDIKDIAKVSASIVNEN